ncbi:MAG: T9SS type A sorting domain-containing protein [Candidatus Hatepunaea meridiana]|nr:T9SS type A sorting domain-containing protein [Candidatus Hatepunaea meridiana]
MNVKSLNIVFFIVFFATAIGFAQPGIEWERTFEHPDSGRLHIRHAIKTVDDGVLAVGSVNYSLSEQVDMFALKLTRDFEVEWFGQYGDYVDEENAWYIHENIKDAIQTSDGGYLLAGQLIVYESEDYCYFVPYLVKIDAEGELEWHRYYLRECDEEYWGIDAFYNVEELENGDYFVLAGIRNMLRISSEGDSLTIISLAEDDLRIVIHDSSPSGDGGFLFAGGIVYECGTNYWFSKFDEDGQEVWFNQFGSLWGDECAWHIIPSIHGGSVSLCQPVYDEDFALIALDENGDLLWERYYDPHWLNFAVDLKPTNDGGFIFSTAITENNLSYYYIIRTDEEGREIWTLISDEGYRVRPFPFLIPLSDRSYLILIKTEDVIHYIKTEPDPVYVDELDGESQPYEFTLYSAFPNPFNRSTTISFNIPKADQVQLTAYDLTGRPVAALVNNTLQAGKHTYTWEPDEISGGLYLLRLEAGGSSFIRKIVYLP